MDEKLIALLLAGLHRDQNRLDKHLQVLAGAYMLQRRQLPVVLTLGIAKNGDRAKGYATHAWLRCGGIILTGEGGHEIYQPLSTFSSSP
mgnify:CR=1 FL=1